MFQNWSSKPCAAGRSVLEEEMEEINNCNPFADEVDEEEMEETEACIESSDDDGILF